MTNETDEYWEDSEFREFLEKRLQTQRYADTWFPGRRSKNQAQDKWIGEKICVQFFQAERPEYLGKIFKPETDPPDVGVMLPNGLKFGFEVTELVHTPTIIENLKYYKNGRNLLDYRYTNYHSGRGRQLFLKQLSDIISVKDKKLRDSKATENYCHHILLVASDEPYLQEPIVEEFLSSESFISEEFSNVFLMLSYHPKPDEKGNYPVFKIC